MKVSVVICTYAEEMYDDFQEATESLLTQSCGRDTPRGRCRSSHPVRKRSS